MKFIITICLCFGCFGVFGQKMAVTETGESVILFDDGSWEYEFEDSVQVEDIPVNPASFSKDSKSTFLLKSKRVNMGFYLNPKEWSFKNGENNSDAEYELQLKEGDLYGMIITEKLEIPIETLRYVALENASAAAPDVKIIKEEYRMVNGLKVLFLQMNGTLQGIKFSYYGYYFSSIYGSVQFITYTSQNLLEDYKAKCENLINGLVEIDK